MQCQHPLKHLFTSHFTSAANISAFDSAIGVMQARTTSPSLRSPNSHRLRYLLLFQLPATLLDWNGWMEGRELNKTRYATNVTPLREANFAHLRGRWISLRALQITVQVC